MGDKRFLRVLFAGIVLLCMITSVHAAKSGHIKLLAVSESGDQMHGSVADLYLEITRGSGRVFIDTFPLTKVDTQISTRFAKEIACDYIQANCDKYDFIYTIRSGSSIIGGPSAGAAITALTIALLEDYEIDESVTITGTINSGGIVGNVGGVKAKVEAAAQDGLSKALIPETEQIHTVDENTTINLVEYGDELGIEVIPVSDIDQVVFEFTGKIIKEQLGSLELDSSYTDTMKFLAQSLCERTDELQSIIGEIPFNSTQETLNESAHNLTTFSKQAYVTEDFYSAASYCFGANIRYNHIDLLQKNHSNETLHEINNQLAGQIQTMHDELSSSEIKTITDLEAFMVVTERALEALQYTKFVTEALGNNDTALANQHLAYALERYKSAESWSSFRNKPGKEFIFDNAALEQSCNAKLAEVEERVQYVRFFIPDFFSGEQSALARAHIAREEGSYEICLFKASMAKAEANVVLSAVGITEGKLDILLEKKQSAVQRIIVEQTQREIFPILGYSYYEYSHSLSKNDIQSALLYSEYALELSRMDMYFESKKETTIWDVVDIDVFQTFVTGALFGMVSGMLLMWGIMHDRKKKRKKQRMRRHHF